MNNRAHEPCYGQMLPESLHATPGRKAEGKVFSFVVAGPAGLCRPARRLEINQQAWDDCVRCREFDHCYKLSMARLSLETAVAGF